ncbi:hypothetical protein [Methylomonas koyamae]|nr:hypothetical protein [Methylomonas koyamae]
MSNDKKHNRPKYSLEFKQDAAKLVLEKASSLDGIEDSKANTLKICRD